MWIAKTKINGSWNNVKSDFKKVCQNIGESFKTGEKINVSGPEKQKDISAILYF